MRPSQLPLRRERTTADGSWHHRPIEMTLDSRNNILDQEIGGDWEPELQAQSRKSNVCMGPLGEPGILDGEGKIENYRAMGPAPWGSAEAVLLTPALA